jgi:hypothetical protein
MMAKPISELYIKILLHSFATLISTKLESSFKDGILNNGSISGVDLHQAL